MKNFIEKLLLTAVSFLVRNSRFSNISVRALSLLKGHGFPQNPSIVILSSQPVWPTSRQSVFGSAGNKLDIAALVTLDCLGIRIQALDRRFSMLRV